MSTRSSDLLVTFVRENIGRIEQIYNFNYYLLEFIYNIYTIIDINICQIHINNYNIDNKYFFFRSISIDH